MQSEYESIATMLMTREMAMMKTPALQITNKITLCNQLMKALK
jgi:hypothetical protein